MFGQTAKGHGGEQRRGTHTFLEKSRQPGRSTSNHGMEEGTRGNDWTSEPQQILPRGGATKKKGGAEEGPQAGTDPHTGRKVHPGGSLSVGAYRKPLREKSLQTNSNAQVNTKESKRRNSGRFKFDS